MSTLWAIGLAWLLCAVAVSLALAAWLKSRRRADLSDVLAGRIAAHPVPVADIYDRIDAHFLAAAAILQPDGDYRPGAWDLADDIAFRRDCATYRYEYRLPGECAQ